MADDRPQLCIRAPAQVLDALRAESERRGTTLGETVAILLDLAQAEADRESPGLWVPMEVELLDFLRGEAVVRATTPDDLLRRLVRSRLEKRRSSA